MQGTEELTLQQVFMSKSDKGYILPGSKSMLRLEGFRKLFLANLVIHDHGVHHKNVYFDHIQSSPPFLSLAPSHTC